MTAESAQARLALTYHARAVAAEERLAAVGELAQEMGAAHTFDQWDDLCVRLRELVLPPAREVRDV